ncbi:alkaline shock response membrane anchor protein AmaP [Arthrobacter caoxuetaonis]|uniref:Alkaline shock response membrane anchor protein AmaP n=1 Tax=Arthrobacter caoxuetaonis TaxID=2886935 RepID=A0A9X1MDS8_9MICC|nr:alkaline shock response membrane anchor protein AmaP [Arthrobacter caoxuetaonis]MCC3281914.1 alkaline shock response membrane anchor protein AmaP [Arthrobacter caoxuetaonis]MCC3283047.1 alkaline shock response membrane anchor protein AmaP [Arthrobacter caoxuetaonis]MCC3298164.1 alkaline shock response membrane anchor protein AmaP [Arthrobacter caoxuetaonis]USQ57168.1 alkaline shock response membrane anchor protein AmaP [Arthrobacter caoxuetaonis]
MRHHAGATNRTWLIIIGAVLLAAGILSLLLSAGALGGMMPGPDSAVLPDGPETLLQPDWVAPSVLIGGIILGILGLWWLLAEVPRKKGASGFRLQEDPARGITTCEPGVLARAVEQDANSVPGVVDSSVLLRGTADSPDVAMRLTVNERSDIQESLRRVCSDVLPNLSQALETPLHTVGISLEVSARRAQLGNTVESTGTVVY